MRLIFLGLLNLVAGYSKLGLNAKIEGIQNSEWKYFLLEKSFPPESKGTLRIRLESEPKPHGQLVLAQSSETAPYFTILKTTVRAQNVDYNAWKERRNVHYLTIPVSQLSTEDPIYIGIGRITNDGVKIPYTLTSEFSEGPLCPNDCTMHGKCAHYVCKCDEGFIDYDCSVPAVLINEREWYSIEVPIGTTRYAYFFLNDKEILKLNLKWHGAFSFLSLNWKGYLHQDLPTETIYYGQTLLTTNKDSKIVEYDQNSMKGDVIYLAIINRPRSEVVLNLEIMINTENIEQEESPDYYLIFLGICIAFLIGMFVIIAIQCCLFDPSEIASSPALPNKFINEHFSKAKYQDLDGEYEKMCIICMEEFSSNHEVRQLTCKHVFHAKCIEEWFKLNTVCCLCKRDFTPAKGLNSTIDM